MFFLNGERSSRLLWTILFLTSTFGVCEVSNPEDFDDLNEGSSWMTDPESFWEALDAFLDLHKQMSDGGAGDAFRLRRQKRDESEGDYGDNLEDNDEDVYGDNLEDNDEDVDGEDDVDDFEDDDEDTYDGGDSESLFQFLRTPTGDSPGWDNAVDLVQFAVDIHEAVSRIAEHGDYGTSGESGDGHQQEFSYSWDRRGKEKDEATHTLQEEEPGGGPLTESPPPEGTEGSHAPELQANFGREEGGAGKRIEEGEDGIREEREGRVEGKEDENESDLPHDRFPRSERDEGKKNEKGKYWRHKPYRTSFASFFPLFQFDLPFGNFRFLSLQDPLPLPEE